MLIGYGFVKVFKIVTPDGDIDEVNVLPPLQGGRTLTTGRLITSGVTQLDRERDEEPLNKRE